MKYSELKELNPLVVNIANIVTANDIANILTTIGASPIITNDIREQEDLLNLVKQVGGSLVINIGTINKEQENLILESIRIANEKGIKVVLDPVGAGATNLRTELALKLLNDFKVDYVRGNFSEINALMGSKELVKGVDASSITNIKLATEFASKYNVAVMISGEDDYMATPDSEFSIINRGSKYLPKISGSGCMLSSIVGAYAALSEDKLLVMKQSIAHVLLAAEKAEKNANTIIEFKNNFFKEMEIITDEEINL